MRFYAIVGSIHVIHPSSSKMHRMFDSIARRNKTSLSAKEAKDFFYSRQGGIALYPEYNAALLASIKRSTNTGVYYNEEFYPDSYKFLATPIYTVELPDNFPLNEWTEGTIELKDKRQLKIADALHITNLSPWDFKRYYCEKKDVLALLAVDIPHPDFKNKHVEIDTQANQLRK